MYLKGCLNKWVHDNANRISGVNLASRGFVPCGFTVNFSFEINLLSNKDGWMDFERSLLKTQFKVSNRGGIYF